MACLIFKFVLAMRFFCSKAPWRKGDPTRIAKPWVADVRNGSTFVGAVVDRELHEGYSCAGLADRIRPVPCFS
jgi:hypothetical protein